MTTMQSCQAPLHWMMKQLKPFSQVDKSYIVGSWRVFFFMIVVVGGKMAYVQMSLVTL